LRTLSGEESSTYIKLNSQTPCPPRGAVPVNQGYVGGSFTLNTHFAFGHGSDPQAMSQEFGTTAKALKAFHLFVQSGEANDGHVGTTVPIGAQNRHPLPHLPVLRTGKAVLPGIYH
jgi:hypothetical protein